MVAACPACSDQSMVRACCKPCRLAGRWTATKAHYSSLIQPYKTKRICSLAVACVKFCCACLPDSRSMRDPFNFPFTTAHNSPKNTGQSAPCPKRKPVVHLHLTTTEAGEALRANGVPASVCAPSTGLDLSTASREKCQYRDPENGGFRSSKQNTPMAHLGLGKCHAFWAPCASGTVRLSSGWDRADRARRVKALKADLRKSRGCAGCAERLLFTEAAPFHPEHQSPSQYPLR